MSGTCPKSAAECNFSHSQSMVNKISKAFSQAQINALNSTGGSSTAAAPAFKAASVPKAVSRAANEFLARYQRAAGTPGQAPPANTGNLGAVLPTAPTVGDDQGQRSFWINGCGAIGPMGTSRGRQVRRLYYADQRPASVSVDAWRRAPSGIPL